MDLFSYNIFDTWCNSFLKANEKQFSNKSHDYIASQKHGNDNLSDMFL